ncbi:MAG: hypothetical protein LIO54_09440 [Oscillospiraceae bacterium]|nr:hypothetical protein [Oscillospiraceae bacterium]
MYFIITKNHIPGFHYWEAAPDDIAYLQNRHRHIFDITCKIPVTHDDRDKEIIAVQADIEAYLFQKYGTAAFHIDIGGMSCEMLAKELADVFEAVSVVVQEDGQGGAEYVREEY